MHCSLISAVRFEESSQRAIPTIGLFYIRSYLEKLLPDFKVSVARTPQELIDSKPDLIGISSVTENMSVAAEWAADFREKLDVPIIIGGDHISALPGTLPPEFDAGVIGEGERTFLELARLIGKNPDWRKKLHEIDGICFRQNGKIVINRERDLIANLDEIPFPRRDKNIWGGFHYIFSSRGCPYNCTFCSPKVIWKCYRTFSAQYVIREMDDIFENFKPFYVHFFDDLFIGDKSRVAEISSLVRKRGYNTRAVFGGHIRADMMDDDLCRHLKEMNFISGAFGAESGSPKVLKFLKAGSTSVEMNQRAIDICNRHQIDLNLSFIIGTPGETEKDLEMTLDFINLNREKMKGIEVFILLPYPGTPVWTYAKRKGLVSETMNWDLFRTKAFFSEMTITDDFLYLNDAIDRDVFREYVEKFKAIDAEMNKSNTGIFEFIEGGVPALSEEKNRCI